MTCEHCGGPFGYDKTSFLEPDGDVVIQSGALSINLSKMLADEDFSEEQKVTLARQVCWGDVMKEALARLSGESSSWDCTDSVESRDFLLKVAGQAKRVKYTELENAITGIKDSAFEHRLYWKAYHEENPKYAPILQEWLKVRGFSQSNHCDTEANAYKDKIKTLVEEALGKWLSSSITPEEVMNRHD